MNKFLLVIILLAHIQPAIGQLLVDAGDDVVVCNDWLGMDTVQLGGNPTASGGIPPYTYSWETTWTVGSWTYTASDFLDDTTLANPTVIYTGEHLTFYLTVTDSESNTGIDTIVVDFTNFGTHLGTVTFNIQQGDSIYLFGCENVFGGFPPYRYLWRPNHGLLDSTSLHFWAKPDSSVAYYLSATDSSGCTAVGAPVYYINVLPVSVNPKDDHNSEVRVFPNPATDHICIKVPGNHPETKIYRFYDSQGRLQYETQASGRSISVETKHLGKGLNFYSIQIDGRPVGQGKIVVQ